MKNWLICKDPDAGKDGKQEEETSEDEIVTWHHRLDGHEFEQAPGVGEGQGSLEFCSHGVTKSQWLNWTESDNIAKGVRVDWREMYKKQVLDVPWREWVDDKQFRKGDLKGAADEVRGKSEVHGVSKIKKKNACFKKESLSFLKCYQDRNEIKWKWSKTKKLTIS